MSSEKMEADDSVEENNGGDKDLMDATITDVVMEAEEFRDKSHKNEERLMWPPAPAINKSFSTTHQTSLSAPTSLPIKAITFSGTNGNTSNGTNQNGIKSVWSIRSPLPINSCANTFIRRRKSHENTPSKQQANQMHVNANNKPNSGTLPTTSPSSVFISRVANQHHTPNLEEAQRDSNLLKRCNSAPILNDIDDSPIAWHRSHVSNSGRTRRFSATVVSSPISSAARSRLRLHQLQKEESIAGIQNKETEHEREVQATIQISSNCGEMSLNDRRSSLDSALATSPRSGFSSASFPSLKPHFPTPTSTLPVGKGSHSRAIDFSTPAHPAGTLSPTHPHHPTPHIPGGIPSPLTFSASPCLFNLSPLPPSPTRGVCGPGKQCFSPSMQVPVSLARATSRSPSPSPTRRTFVTRRRSQSPCIMRPSALGPIKRKYDSDSEGGCSPKRIFIHAPNMAPHNVTGDVPMTNTNNTPLGHRVIVHRSHSLSSSSVDSSDLYVSPSPPHQGATSFVNHHHGNHAVTGFLHPLHHSSSPMHPHSVHSSQIPLDSSNRCSSPASSTCSSSSLEGLRDLQPLTSPLSQVIAPKKS